MNEVKSVRFYPNVKILHMHVWTFAYRDARKSNWRSLVLDRYRFEMRKQILEKLLTQCGFFSK